MNNHGFLRVAAAIPELKVADCEFNAQQIQQLIIEADQQNVSIVCFPELSITGYTCGDLFLQQTLIQAAEQAVKTLLEETQDLPICFIIGVPVEENSKLYNCALVCQSGQIHGIVPKTCLPNYSEFYEKRWFEPFQNDLDTRKEQIDGTKFPVAMYLDHIVPFSSDILFGWDGFHFAVEICEDVWSVIPPSSHHAMNQASLIFNLSASPELIGKQQYVKSLLSQQSARCHAGYVYAGAGFGESTTDLVYAGNAYIYENGKLLAESQRFQFQSQLIVSEIDFELLAAERQKNTSFISKPCQPTYQAVPLELSSEAEYQLSRKIAPYPFIPATENYSASCEEIFSIQVAGLSKRILHARCKSMVVGISGGVDSTLALLVCVKTADKLGLSRKSICGVTMPGYGTSNRTYQNALHLMQSLGITHKEINIIPACEQHFKDISHDPKQYDVTYENTQARERTQILMDLANQQNGLVIGTGDLSELALGWATYNGDQMSMYGVNSGIPKTLVRHLIKWVAETQMDSQSKTPLIDIIETPVSPELLPADKQGKMTQFTEDVVGPYDLHDFFLYYTLRYGFSPSKIYYLAQYAFEDVLENAVIRKWLEVFFRRFFSNQFKRSCMPDGPKVGSVNLSPRGDWRMPSDASANLWLKEISSLED
ncbi:MAG: Glutamine-dependent NAD(+) synthetase [Candidatus Ordinivivax streblomastigis]|uniref:Glutamine-dependent NAD(+) synthetase n=1 Tax=Candidatus Ordinivivax streblomastigis TaxID=2540710 RepID=A0A5M8P2K3_9BACT|nr:MAG: Glutamine-dependent NAD(+) synthetase [Candidatus Ordinivivax streblomastigis]